MQYSAKKVIDELQGYISPARQQRIETVIAGRINSIHLALEAPSDINNALATLRSCEALGVAHIHLIQAEKRIVNIRSITRGAFYWVNRYYYSSMEEFLTYIKSQNILLAGGVAYSSASRTLAEIPINQEKICLLLGNEHHGLSTKAIEACDFLYQIPMYGMSESLNLSVSAAISLYDTTTRKRNYLRKNSDLTPAEQLETKAYYYLTSVDSRLIQALFKM